MELIRLKNPNITNVAEKAASSGNLLI